MKRQYKKLSLAIVVSITTAAVIGLAAAFLNNSRDTQKVSTDKDEGKMKKIKVRASVHDPSIAANGNTYYVFGSNLDAAKSTDLINWQTFTNGYAAHNNAIFGELSKNLAVSFAWAGEGDGDFKGGAVWAPFVFWNESYVNSDGTKGTYMIYYCTSSTYKRSAIGYAVSKNIEGPYTYVDTIIYSGFTKIDNYDDKSSNGSVIMSTVPNDYSKINTKYTNTNIQKLIDSGKLDDINPNWFSSNGGYNTSSISGGYPNAIDADLFYDKNGRLWMIYGSWSGGTFLLEIDKANGKPIYPGKDGNTDDGRIIDRYFGTKISGGYGKSGEGPCIVYDKVTDYYYLYLSYAGLASNGGYNMRLFRSKNPNGPYVDAAGNSAILSQGLDNSPYGIKLMGNYKFSSLDKGYKSPGGNTSFIDSNGNMYLVYHTRFENAGEYNEVRVHQMFVNELGWPVAVPYEYDGDAISKTGYSINEVIGAYEFINHGTSNSPEMAKTMKVNLNKDKTVTGDVTGKWSMTNGTYYMQIVIDGVTYNGIFFKQHDESKNDLKVMTFSAIGSNNECIWGSKR